MNARVVLSPVSCAMWGGIDGVGFLCYGRPEKAVSCLPARPRVARGNLRGLESRAVLREPFAVGGRPKLLPCLRCRPSPMTFLLSRLPRRRRHRRSRRRAGGHWGAGAKPRRDRTRHRQHTTPPPRAPRPGRRAAAATTTSPRRAPPPRRRGIALKRTYNWPKCAWRQAHDNGCMCLSTLSGCMKSLRAD